MILNKQVTLLIGLLLKLIPLVPQSLGQGTKELWDWLESSGERWNQSQTEGNHEKMTNGERKVWLQPCELRNRPGTPKEWLITVSTWVGQAKMMAVINSGAMVNVISEWMFIASGLAQNKDTLMELSDANGGMIHCEGMILDAKVYLTESGLPTVGDLWVHPAAVTYNLPLGRIWSLVNWGIIQDLLKGTYVNFGSKGQNWVINADLNPEQILLVLCPKGPKGPGVLNLSRLRAQQPWKVHVVEIWKETKEESLGVRAYGNRCLHVGNIVSRIQFWTSKIHDITQEIHDMKSSQNLASHQE